MEEKLYYFRLILTIYKELRQLLNDAANQKKEENYIVLKNGYK